MAEPYWPAAHGVQALEPAKLYLPTGQGDAVGDVEPAGHTYPAVQLPLQPAVPMPDTAPYRPALQFVHAPVPPKLY